MAVGSGSVSKSVSEKNNRVKSPLKKESNAPLSSPAKRNRSPGIRMVGGRIYDPVNGKTCHQCRQKTRDFAAACKNQTSIKPCPIMYCHKCLLNRYGEKAEEVAALGDWSCPRCRGICNCSVCMKKRGHQPTGILTATAKATGFSSVSEMLLNGAERLNHENAGAVMVPSPKKEVVPSPRKPGKENSCDGKVDVNLPNHVDKKSLKVNEVHNETGSRGSEKSNKMKRDRLGKVKSEKHDEILKKSSAPDDEKKPKKRKKDELKNNVTKKRDAAFARRTSPRKLTVSDKVPNEGAKLNTEVDPEKNMNNKITVPRKDLVKRLETVKREGEVNSGNDDIVKHNTDFYDQIPLPLGKELNRVAKIDISADDAGNALQFLEFCAVFGKIIDVKKGQPEYVLQDLLHGRAGRKGKISVTVQFHIHLLSILQMEQGKECEELSPSNGKSSWFLALKKYFSKSQRALKAQGLDSFLKASDYETLGASEKLRLLNFLCDEVLGTEKLRTWMSDQNIEFAERVKEAKQKIAAAKDKEKSLKQQMRDDIAKAVVAKRGASVSISEHEAIVSIIEQETAKAHAKVLESQGKLLKDRSCIALRVEPIFVGCDGTAYWKLNCSGNSGVLRQNVGEGDSFLTMDEKWFTIDDEGKEAIEKHICSWTEEKAKNAKALRSK